ncbi:hypothetical protein RB653_010524 [Dictyostelium firmibasis]|uniref:Uncharacterized protein n=1 Tax=Dictyostelium firmibasis TaxID=79012 RepID=A0AAN7TK69_9MYCE
MDKYLFCDASIEELKLIKETKPLKKLENISKAIGAPAKAITSLEEYKVYLKEDALSKKSWGLSDFNEPNQTEDDLFKEEVLVEGSDNIKNVFCFIDAYLSNEATIKVTRPNPSQPLTNVELIAIYSRAFQFIYEEEEKEVGNPGHVQGMLNRNQSNGRYGIWGHDLSDLVYNGFSEVLIHKDFIVCDFHVDS